VKEQQMMGSSKRAVLITGIRGTLGQALGRAYARQGWEVSGVSRHPEPKELDFPCRIIVNEQKSAEDANQLLDLRADLIILCAGAIETKIGDQGLPLLESLEDLTTINYLFPARLMLLATERPEGYPLTICAIGSIADGSPSCFGPLYHASKAALHHFCAAVAPIALAARGQLRLRLYRPGVILGPLSWAPVNRLNEKAYRVRARRCQSAPPADRVAQRILSWLEGPETIGSDREPLSFLALKLFYSLAPGLYAKLQNLAWKRASRWSHGLQSLESTPKPTEARL
jgi:NAD(P)-dependent dehydrogenase (short-subunit alcohol dehydrogenase family)